MIIEYIRYRIPGHEQTDFLNSYAQASKALEASATCIGYELTHCEEDPDRFILRIQWTSTEDHLKKFRSSAEFQEFFPLVKPYLDNIEEMQHYRLTDVRSHNTGTR